MFLLFCSLPLCSRLSVCVCVCWYAGRGLPVPSPTNLPAHLFLISHLLNKPVQHLNPGCSLFTRLSVHLCFTKFGPAPSILVLHNLVLPHLTVVCRCLRFTSACLPVSLPCPAPWCVTEIQHKYQHTTCPASAQLPVHSPAAKAHCPKTTFTIFYNKLRFELWKCQWRKTSLNLNIYWTRVWQWCCLFQKHSAHCSLAATDIWQQCWILLYATVSSYDALNFHSLPLFSLTSCSC